MITKCVWAMSSVVYTDRDGPLIGAARRHRVTGDAAGVWRWWDCGIGGRRRRWLAPLVALTLPLLLLLGALGRGTVSAAEPSGASGSGVKAGPRAAAEVAETAAKAAPAQLAPGSELTLDLAVGMALARNPEIERAREEIRRTEGVVVEVRAEALPQVQGVGTYDHKDKDLLEQPVRSAAAGGETQIPEIPVGVGAGGAPVVIVVPASDGAAQKTYDNENRTWRAAIEVHQLLYAGGRVGAALAAARLLRADTRFQLQEVINQTVTDVRKQFYEVLLNRQLIVVAQQSLALLEEQLRDQQSRFAAGTVPRFNVLRAEVEVSNVRPDLIRARNNYYISHLRLAKLLAIDCTPVANQAVPFAVVGEFGGAVAPAAVSAAVRLAKERRPLLQSRWQAILIQKERARAAFAGYLPQLEAVGGYEMRNRQFSDYLDDNIHGWFVGVRGTWDIFDGLATHGKLLQVRAELEKALIAYDDAVRLVELEVEGTHAKVEEARELIESQVKNVEQATEAVRLARERLAAGAGTQLDVLDARTALTRAQVTEVQALYDYQVAMAELARASGVAIDFGEPGWDRRGTRPPPERRR